MPGRKTANWLAEAHGREIDRVSSIPANLHILEAEEENNCTKREFCTLSTSNVIV